MSKKVSPNVKTPHATLLAWADELPPFLCRVMAIRSGSGSDVKRIKVTELIEDSGIKTRRFKYLCNKITWDDVTVGDASRFIAACGVDILHRRAQYEFYRSYERAGGVLKHLTLRQRQKFDRLAIKWKAMQKSAGKR